MKERKEVIVLDGLTILLVAMAISNAVIAGVIYRYHTSEVFRIEKAEQEHYTQLLREVREIKNFIVEAEGASSWAETLYAKSDQ